MFVVPVKFCVARLRSATFDDSAASAIEAAGKLTVDVAVSVPTTKFPAVVEAR